MTFSRPVPSDTPTAPRPQGSGARAARARRISEIETALAAATSASAIAACREELVATNLAVARSVAHRYCGRGIETDDLVQVAYLGLTKAAARYDATTGHAFLSFCVPTVRGEVRRHFRDHGWTVRPPRSIQELQQTLLRRRSELEVTMGRTPTSAELADDLDRPVGDVWEALGADACFTPISLDAPRDSAERGDSLGESLGEEDRAARAAEARVVLSDAVRRLGDRDRRILRLRFFEDLTQREIAEDLGVTQMQVSRLLARIYASLRRDVGPLTASCT